jgi:hypothetical protein
VDRAMDCATDWKSRFEALSAPAGIDVWGRARARLPALHVLRAGILARARVFGLPAGVGAGRQRQSAKARLKIHGLI